MLTHFRQELKALTGRKQHLKRIQRVIVIGITQGVLGLIQIKLPDMEISDDAPRPLMFSCSVEQSVVTSISCF